MKERTKAERDELFRRHEEEQRERQRLLTPLERLQWLEDAQEFARLAAQATRKTLK